MDIQACKIARNYAQAFLNSVPCTLSLSDYERLYDAAGSLKRSTGLVTMLKISLFSPEFKKKELLAWFSALQIPCSIRPLLDLLAEHERLFLFPEVLKQVGAEYAARNGIAHAQIQSVHVLNDAQRSDIREFVERNLGKRVSATFVVKKKLIAGIRVQGTNFVWEHSLRQRLHACATKAV